MIVELVESMKELLLRTLFSTQYMNIIHQQHVRAAVEGVELSHPVQADTGNHLIDETLAGGVDDPHAGVIVNQGASDRVHQVSLSHAYTGVNEQRVVPARRGRCDRLRGGVSKLVAGTNHKIIERIPGI